MIKCQKCNCPIKIKYIFKWVNSGIDSIKCKQCGVVIINANHLLVIYTIAGIFSTVGISFNTEISGVLSSFGLYVTDFFVVMTIIFLCIFLIYSLAVLAVKNNV